MKTQNTPGHRNITNNRTMKFFRLKSDYEGFPANTLLLMGENGEDGQEYFDITTEIRTGKSYSVYNVPEDMLIALSEKECIKYEEFFLDNNYKINPNFN